MEPKSGCVPIGSEVVGGNEDLLAEILVRLPPKSLLRFKSVSKPWLHLISSSQFRHRSSQRLCKDASGLIVMRKDVYTNRRNRNCEFIPLDENAGRNSPLERLDFVEGELRVISHCNGLLLCSNEHIRGNNRHKYYVFNPTTKEYSTISVDLALMVGKTKVFLRGHDVNLAFDPRKSLHYKLLFFYMSDTKVHPHIYSSNTGETEMMQFDESFTRMRHVSIYQGVYWNGAVHWFHWEGGLYFNVDEERLGKLPKFRWPRDGGGCSLKYYGESNDHFHMILTYSEFQHKFDVYEMDRGYSGWSLRFRVDIHCHNLPRGLSVMGVFRKEDGDDDKSFIVLNTLGMVSVFRYNFEDESTAIIYESAFGKRDPYTVLDSIPFIESLYRP